MTTQISGDTGVSQVQDGSIAQADLATAVVPLGVGQTYQNVTGSRLFGTNYTNSTGRPIAVRLVATSTSSGQVATQPTVGGVALGQQVVQVGAVGFKVVEEFVVPNGAVYSVATTRSSATPTLESWVELKA